MAARRTTSGSSPAPESALSKSSAGNPAPTASSSSRHAVSTYASATSPIVRNAIRYTVSEREYELLHRYVLARSRALRRRLPPPGPQPSSNVPATSKVSGPAGSGGGPPAGKKAVPGTASVVDDKDYNARAVRHAIRVFLATGIVMKAWEVMRRRLASRRRGGGSE